LTGQKDEKGECPSEIALSLKRCRNPLSFYAVALDPLLPPKGLEEERFAV
jgi:hypothetical protein